MGSDEQISAFLGVLVCPECQGPLQVSGKTVLCGNCAGSFPFKGQMLDLRNSMLSQNGADWKVEEFDEEAKRIGRRKDFAESFMSPTSSVRLSPQAARVVEIIYQNAIKVNILRELCLKEGDLLVDAGCGNGYFLFDILDIHERLDFRAIGIDVAKPAVEILSREAENLHELRLFGVVSSIEKTPLPNNMVDVIICSEVMEHVVSPENAIREMYRILKQGGKLIVSTPNKTGVDFWHRVADTFLGSRKRPEQPQDSYYERFLYWSKLRRFLLGGGFVVESVRFVKQVPWARVFQLFPSLPPIAVRWAGQFMETAMQSSRWAHNVVVVCKKMGQEAIS